MLTPMIEQTTGLRAIDDVVERATNAPEKNDIFSRTLNQLGINITMTGVDRIPLTGPVIIVSNHPTGFAEGLAVPALMNRFRPDVKTLAHTWFQRWPALIKSMILVNPQAEGSSNKKGFLDAARHLRTNGALMMFPAGEVARGDGSSLQPKELTWRPGLVLLARLAGATILPIHVSGKSGLAYRLLSQIYPRLGSLVLCRDVLSRSGQTIHMHVGNPISLETVLAAGSAEDGAALCRRAVLSLDTHEPPNKSGGKQ